MKKEKRKKKKKKTWMTRMMKLTLRKTKLLIRILAKHVLRGLVAQEAPASVQRLPDSVKDGKARGATRESATPELMVTHDALESLQISMAGAWVMALGALVNDGTLSALPFQPEARLPRALRSNVKVGSAAMVASVRVMVRPDTIHHGRVHGAMRGRLTQDFPDIQNALANLNKSTVGLWVMALGASERAETLSVHAKLLPR
mmetsp:Transcript_80640/g.142803  ORF Transcript_80640/g.142803 Transcript_80640/m.142803 type:complete len:202 (+) Transcript_80640:28-633(+)